MKFDIKDKKTIGIILLILLAFIMIISTLVYKRNKKDLTNLKNLTRLSEEYKEVSKEKNNYIPSNHVPEDKRDVGAIDSKGNKVLLPSEEYKFEKPPIGSEEVSEGNKKITDKLIMDINETINNKDTDKLYSMLNEGYINDFGINEKLFKSGYNYNGKVSITIFKVQQSDDLSSIIISTNITEVESGFQQIKYFTLFEDGTIADIDIFNIQELNKKKTIDDINYTINKRYDTNLSSIYNITIDNQSDRVLDVQEIVTKLNNTIYSNTNIGLNKEVKVYPGVPYNLNLEIANHIGLTNIILKCLDIDGNIFEIDILNK